MHHDLRQPTTRGARSSLQVLERMAMNLLRVFLNARQLENARTVLELLVRFLPDGGTSRFDLAQVPLQMMQNRRRSL